MILSYQICSFLGSIANVSELYPKERRQLFDAILDRGGLARVLGENVIYQAG